MYIKCYKSCICTIISKHLEYGIYDILTTAQIEHLQTNTSTNSEQHITTIHKDNTNHRRLLQSHTLNHRTQGHQALRYSSQKLWVVRGAISSISVDLPALMVGGSGWTSGESSCWRTRTDNSVTLFHFWVETCW